MAPKHPRHALTIVQARTCQFGNRRDPAWHKGIRRLATRRRTPPMSQTDTGPAHHHAGPANRLAGETSPYLLQHAHHPVDWFPWGPEPIARARAENKPIFLSIGYSACHWCHVMER